MNNILSTDNIDFVTEVSSTSSVVFVMIVTLVCTIGFSALAIYLNRKTSSIVRLAFAIVIFVFSIAVFIISTITYLVSGGNLITTIKDTDKFKAWVLDEYLIEINDEQADLLLNNVITEDTPRKTEEVYVTTFTGEDAFATLFNDDDKWRLIITQNIAVPSN